MASSAEISEAQLGSSSDSGALQGILAGGPGSLLADASRKELVARLSKRGRTTRVFWLLGVALTVVGAILTAL